MHKFTRIAMEDAMRVLLVDPPLPLARRQAVARLLEQRIAAENAEIERRCALIRREHDVAIRGPGGASGRVNRRDDDEAPPRPRSGIERSLPARDRD